MRKRAMKKNHFNKFKFSQRQILEEKRFQCIEKIKTTGSTYMCASGLTDETSYSDLSHVMAIAEYAFAIRKQLKYVNEHSWNNFKLRIGKSLNVLKYRIAISYKVL